MTLWKKQTGRGFDSRQLHKTIKNEKVIFNMVDYILLGILAPVVLNLMHLLVGIYVVVQRGSVMSLGFSGISFLTKTIGMMLLTWVGVSKLNLDVQIFVPMLAFFWFFTHIVEAFVIQHYIDENQSEYIKGIQIK